MISDRLLKALNDQIHAELGSAYQYLAMSAWFETRNLPGSAQWMRRQSREELAHGMKIFDFVHDRDGSVLLTAVGGPAVEFGSALEVWEAALKQEQGVTARIHALYRVALEENDFAAQAMLQWFVTEQVEEEKNVRTILEQVRMVGTGSTAMFFVDRHLGKEASG